MKLNKINIKVRAQAINTVNVLEIVEENPQQIISFTDDKNGNKLAEEIFIKIAKENGATDEDMESYVEDGSFSPGNYGVYLIHSS